jgi:hypothetical protein
MSGHRLASNGSEIGFLKSRLPPNNCPIPGPYFARSLVLTGAFMASKLKILSAIIVLLFVSPALATEFTYKEYAKASEVWKRGFVFGISRYMSTVAQPDEEPPYPVRSAFQRCLGDSTDSVLVRHVETYLAANPSASHGPMITVVMRALFDLCRAEISKTPPQKGG